MPQLDPSAVQNAGPERSIGGTHWAGRAGYRVLILIAARGICGIGEPAKDQLELSGVWLAVNSSEK